MQKTLVKAGLSAAVGGIATALLFGNDDLNIFGVPVGSAIVTSGCVGVGSVASDLISEYVIENMDVPTNVKSIEENLVRIGVCGGSTSLFLYLAGVRAKNIPITFLLGASSKFGGDWAEEQLFGQKGMVFPNLF